MAIAPAPRSTTLIRPLMVIAAAAWTCACASAPSAPVTATAAPVDPNSAVAAEVAAMSGKNGPYPRFEDMPKTPRDIRPQSAWSRTIYDTLRLRRVMLIEAAMAGPPPEDTEQFAQSVRDRAAAAGTPSAESAATLNHQGDFVTGARQRATPPSQAR